MGEYTIRGGRQGKSRLDVLAEVMRPSTAALLDSAGVRAGARCLDVGCGGGHVTVELARRAGPSGSVVAVDLDAEVLELARLDAKEEGLETVDFRVGDARHPGGGPYDVVYSRFLLSHLSGPEEIVAGFARLLAPGGVLITEDVDFSSYLCHPAHPAVERAVALYRETVRRRGGDPDLGLRLPGLLCDAGLRDVQAGVAQPIGLRGPTKRILPLTIAQMSESITAAGVTGPGDVADLVADLHALAEDGSTLFGMPRVIQAWGHAPAGGSKLAATRELGTTG